MSGRFTRAEQRRAYPDNRAAGSDGCDEISTHAHGQYPQRRAGLVREPISQFAQCRERSFRDQRIIGQGRDCHQPVDTQLSFREGIGEQLVPVTLAPAWFLLADPGVGASTRALFQAPDLTREAPPATMSDFVSGRPLGNAFEPVLRRLLPAVDGVLVELSRFGPACVTGSGSTCFVRFASQAEAEAARAGLPSGLRAWVAAGAPRSPLLDALERRGRPERPA